MMRTHIGRSSARAEGETAGAPYDPRFRSASSASASPSPRSTIPHARPDLVERLSAIVCHARESGPCRWLTPLRASRAVSLFDRHRRDRQQVERLRVD